MLAATALEHPCAQIRNLRLLTPHYHFRRYSLQSRVNSGEKMIVIMQIAEEAVSNYWQSLRFLREFTMLRIRFRS